MAAALLTLIIALIVGVMGLIAQAGRASRQASVALLVVLLAFSALISLLGAFTGLGLLLMASGTVFSPGERFAFIAAGVAALLAGAAGIALCAPLFRKLLGRQVKREFWTDPPIVLALWLSVMVLANSAVSFLIFTQTSDLSTLFPGGRVSPLVILTSQLPFIIVAVMGVGAGVRRDFRETLRRLGYGKVSLANLGVVALFVVAALGLSSASDALFSALQPDLASRVGELSDNLFSPRGLSPVSAVLFALLIGVGAGLGEETLFRGALQPVLGITFTSILFATLHVQYGPSLLLGYILLLAFGLGFLRKKINTTASFLAHAGYNSIGVLLSYFFS